MALANWDKQLRQDYAREEITESLGLFAEKTANSPLTLALMLF
jgi:hypothetical protein